MRILKEEDDMEVLNVVHRFAKGEEVFHYCYADGVIKIYTEEEGYLLIKEGKNLLEEHQQGKVLGCYSWTHAGFRFITAEQGVVCVGHQDYMYGKELDDLLM